jgi:hypothetical protein
MSGRELDIEINQVAQGLKEMSEFLATVESLAEEEERSILRRVIALALQAGAADGDVAAALDRCGVRATRTTAVLLAKGRIDIQLAKISALPRAELHDGLRLSMALLAIADDRRRRTLCANGCHHWWHRNLRDDVVLARIRRGV